MEVSAADPDLDGDKGTVSLTWTWDVKGNEWSYRSSADLAKDGDTWKVVWQRNLVEPSLTGKEVIDVDVLLPSRGAILGPDETPIVVDRDVVKLGLDKSTLTRAEEAVSARAIARVLDIEVASFTKRVRASGEKAFVEAWCCARPTPRTCRRRTARSRAPWPSVPAPVGADEGVRGTDPRHRR